ncbi:AfsR/SARP family transcriptional regulator [Streptosporangium sp. CA-135522]|uniref:AfsR/SARP family transcriptional regulator n=1 Tax=Streptosporangium sp. CA-135522 TaxID=3240072 RepID=UPI003D8EDA7E
MDIRLLGPLEARDQQGTPITVTSAKQRVVLAALALQVRQVVSVDDLVDCLWDEKPPVTARETLHSHVMRLRKALSRAGRVPLVTHAPGYVLDIEPEYVDVHQVQALRAQAGRAAGRGDVAGAAALLKDALARWRGPLLADVDSAMLRSRHVRAWEDIWIQTMETRVDADLSLGRHADILGELRSLAAGHPFRERFRGQLMVALDACGQRAQALQEYQDVRKLLVEELGIEPGPYLRQIHSKILNADADEPAPLRSAPSHSPVGAVPQSRTSEHDNPDQALPGPVPAPAPVAARVAALLPLDVYGFTGRNRELARLDAILASAGEQPTAVIISALSGTAGVGKTALAVHWAHRIRDRFPDGQLYVNLRGFDPSGSKMRPSEAIRGFLNALGVPAERVPVAVNDQVGLYRSLLSGRRMLVVLDNARDAEQVRPLLPGAPGCLVVVTSRNRLSGLVAAEGAHPLSLDLLPVSEARELLARRLGRQRVETEPEAVEKIIAGCARLPLALAVAAARAATHPRFPLAVLADELHEARGGLDAFDSDDSATQVRGVFSWSYHTLGSAAAWLFRLLGLHPGPDLTISAVASLAGVPVTQARPLLTELIRAQLIIEHVPGRYTFHDLLRAYAAELVHVHNREAEHRTALRRMFDHYLHTAHAATRLLGPHRDPITPAAPQPGVTCVSLTDHQQALAWFATEHSALLAAVDRAAGTGFDTYAWQLAWTLTDFLDRQGRWHDQIATQETALAAARREGSRSGQAHAHRNLGWAHTRLDHHDDAHTHFRHALDLYDELGDHTGKAHTHGNLSGVFERQGRYEDALDHAQRALALYRLADHRPGRARALNAVGWLHALLGDHHKALIRCQQALVLHQESEDQHGQAVTWDSLGYAHHRLGDYRQAAACYEQALSLIEESGDRLNQAGTLTHLGDTLYASGAFDAARRTWKQALDILKELGHPDTEKVRVKLNRSAPGVWMFRASTTVNDQETHACSPAVRTPRTRPTRSDTVRHQESDDFGHHAARPHAEKPSSTRKLDCNP